MGTTATSRSCHSTRRRVHQSFCRCERSTCAYSVHSLVDTVGLNRRLFTRCWFSVYIATTNEGYVHPFRVNVTAPRTCARDRTTRTRGIPRLNTTMDDRTSNHRIRRRHDAIATSYASISTWPVRAAAQAVSGLASSTRIHVGFFFPYAAITNGIRAQGRHAIRGLCPRTRTCANWDRARGHTPIHGGTPG